MCIPAKAIFCSLVFFIIAAEASKCPRLTAPLNGGLECNKTGDIEICRVYCDVDYEFLMLYDTFEMNCGPSTGFVWSHTMNNQTMPECVCKY